MYLSGVPSDVNRVHPGRARGGGLAGAEPAGTDGDPTGVGHRLRDLRDSLGRDRRIPRPVAPARSAGMGRHDVFFDLAETVSWMHDLPRMEAHVLDAGHLLIETHSAAAAPLILDSIERSERTA